jgi:hypothetical protein
VRHLRSLLVLWLLLPLSGCFGYRLIRPEEVPIPSYEAREVPVPAECDALIQRAATQGVGRLTEVETRTVVFCQNQQIRRAQEEEAAARKLEAHAATAGFALQVVTVAVGATIAVISWLFF